MAVYLPFFLSLVILNVALPLLFVFAVYVFLPTLIVTLTFLSAFLPDFKVIVYFFTFFLALKVFLEALILVDLSSVKDELSILLDSYLRVDENGNKRLAVPVVYAVKKGKIKGHHIGTVSSYKNPTKGMSKKQKKELEKIYTNLIKEIK